MKILSFDGHLAKDAEIKTTQKGTQYLSFRVGNTTYVKGENKTDWIDVASFNVNDITAKGPYMKKGSHVFVVGTPDTTVNPGKDGRLYVNTSVFADRIEFISSGKKDKEGENGTTTSEPELKVESASAPQATNYADVEKELSQTTVPPQAEAAPSSGDNSDDELPF